MGNLDPSLTRQSRMVGRYRVYSELASGGMATVHLGCLLGPAGFSKLVAIKCLHQEYASKPEFVSMFLDEARLASTIHHPNVVASLDVVAEQGELLVVMEYVHGETLAGLLRLARQKGEVTHPAVIARVLCDALEGLHAAHTASLAGRCLDIVHRDVSPQNIIVGADGNTRVLDFGIAKAALRSQVTSAGMVRGKVAYMSPEQVQSQGVDRRTDVFAAGVVLWEALTGRRLFYSADAREGVTMLLQGRIVAPSVWSDGLTRELDQVVLKALERNVDARFQSAHEFAEALRRAVGEGSRSEVAAWVNGLATEGLARRLALLQELEASAIHTQAAISSSALRSEATVPSSAMQTQATVAWSLRNGSSANAASAARNDATHTKANTVTSILPNPPATGWHQRAPWVFAAAGVLSALGVWLHVSSREPARNTGSLEPTGPKGAAAAVAAAPTSEPVAATDEASHAAHLPVITAESMPLAPSPPATVVAKPVERRRVVEPSPTRRVAAGRAAACSPPYRIDASGVRRVKPECI